MLHSSEGDIHYNLYTPESYDGSEPRALFVTLAAMRGCTSRAWARISAEDFGFEAQDYDPDMLVLAPQLNDWGETSARQTIALVEYFLAEYSIDPRAGLPARDERRRGDGLAGHGHAPGALCRLPRHQHALGRRPGRPRRITHAGIHGDRPTVTATTAPSPLTDAYNELHAIYASQGLSDAEIDGLLVLDVRSQDFFDAHGFSNQHAGGQAFAHDGTVMGWLFSHTREESIPMNTRRDVPARARPR